MSVRDAAPSLLERHLSLRVWALAQAFESHLARELAVHGLSIAGFRLIGELMLAPEGLRPGELARRLGVKPPSVTAMVAKLEAAGLVVTGLDPDDARGTRVRLAPNASLQTGLEVLERLDRALLGAASPTTRAALGRALDHLLDQLAQDPEGTPR